MIFQPAAFAAQAFLVIQRIDGERLAGFGAGDQVVEVPVGVAGPDLTTMVGYLSSFRSTWRRLRVKGRTCVGQRPASTAFAQASLVSTSALSSKLVRAVAGLALGDDGLLFAAEEHGERLAHPARYRPGGRQVP